MTWQEHLTALDEADPISTLELERDVYEAYHHWFSGHFADRVVNLEPDLQESSEFEAVTFPLAIIKSGVASLEGPPKTEDKPEVTPFIHTIIQDQRHDRGGSCKDSRLTVSHYVRVARRGSSGRQDDATSRRIADLVAALYESEAWCYLNRLGFHRRAHVRGPVALPVEGFATRLVTFQVWVKQHFRKGQKNRP